MNKILTFSHNIINNPNSPSELKIILKPEKNIVEEEARPEDFIELRFRRNIRKNVNFLKFIKTFSKFIFCTKNLKCKIKKKGLTVF